MGKSVYSIVLQDEVVRAVDALAYRQGVSRSALMNRLLAQAVHFTTPEERMRGIFGALQRALEPLPEFQLLDTASEAMCRMTSALRYKYNPVVRYGVELYRDADGAQGELKVSLRSQSAGLLQQMNDFFVLWRTMENQTLRCHYPGGVPFEIEVGRCRRTFAFSQQAERLADDELGGYIAAYIRVFDGAMKQYFSYAETPAAARQYAVEYYAAEAPKLFEKCIF